LCRTVNAGAIAKRGDPATLGLQQQYRGVSAVADNDSGDHKITLAEQIFGKAATIPKGNPPERHEPNVHSTATPGSALSRRSLPDASNIEPGEGVNQQRELKTAAELAKMIEADLAGHPDCPGAGFRVTVYGWPHWRAMLTITPAAGRVRNPQEWRELTIDLADRLRKRYDLAWE